MADSIRPLSTEAVRSLYGAYRLARGDRGGLTWFNPTLGGFWRSFWAAALIFPMFAALRMLSYSTGDYSGTAIDPLRIGLVESIAYVVSWVVFPLIMIYVSRLLGVGHNFFRFMTAYNWAMVWQNLVYVTAAFLTLGGILDLDQATATFLSLVVIVAVFVYLWFIVSVTLELSPTSAVAVVVLDLLLGLFLHGLTYRMLTG